MIKILKDEKVYIPVSEIRECGITVKIPQYIKESHPVCGTMILEEDYNAILASDTELLEKNGGHPELTRVSSLACKIKDINALSPLKYMFLISMKMDKDAAIQKIEEENKEEIRKEQESICVPEKVLAQKYNKCVAFLQENEKYIEEKLTACGLQLQFLTEIGEAKKPGLMCFVAGVNVFYQIYISEWRKEDFDRFEKKKDGVLIVPEPEEYEDAEVNPENIEAEESRDFRNYTVRENLAWCLQNIQVKNDFADELNYYKDGIHFCVNIRLFAKLINHKAFPETLFVDGLVEFEEDTIVPQKPD